MAAASALLVFTELMEQFRQLENNEHDTLDEQVESLLSSNGQSFKGGLTMDRSPSDEVEFLVFDALIARKEINHLGFASTFDASRLLPLVRRIEKGKLRNITLGGMSLSGSQSTEFFDKLLDIGVEISWSVPQRGLLP